MNILLRSQQDLRTALATMVGIVLFIGICIFVLALIEWDGKDKDK